MQPSVRYLGVWLDSHLNFEEYFRRVGAKATGVSRALCRLMPNLRGPNESKRRLYANVVTAVILYRASIWSPALDASAKSGRLLRGFQRDICIRVCSTYRTASFAAVTLLARSPLWALVAAERRRVFLRVRDMRRGGNATLSDVDNIRMEEGVETRPQWETWLGGDGIAGEHTRLAILPCMNDWMMRNWGSLHFHMTQIITGHGCFGTYLARIGKVPNARCFYCPAVSDSSEHTLMECTAWIAERDVLKGVLGRPLSLAAVLEGTVSRREVWSALSTFCSALMRAKEEAERLRQAPNPPRRNGDPG
ncbi:hypothetical protein DMN91_006887 [Ooceraea biroi]|uniref:Reverse transcriptase zinc-binding domain-containing protein n=1 Tax=Ooceraea biroi TaxID=2015173 RepID=A0A3L8DIL1_OOCBI|nr:uncharacterized protein LOC105279384 [Ooceraea biroi]RLU20280.1 hypothetical protein DMN91_006887 [Ooceraea biroi]